MADILLYGATGYTGRLVARALLDRGADFVIAGRDVEKLETLAATVGHPDVYVIPSGDTGALVKALAGSKVLITCVGPFLALGDTAVEAAFEAGVHYIDSTGEGPFIERLITHDARAREAGIALAPAMGFDEVPGDLACALAAEGLEDPTIHVTYALPKTASAGTLRSMMGIVASEGPWLEDGDVRLVRAGEEKRWAPMPHPLGPRRAASFPLALCHLAPRHIECATFRTYVTTARAEAAAMKIALPVLAPVLRTPLRGAVEGLINSLPEGPSDEARATGLWTILAEARSRAGWRNVAISGTDVYGLTAEMLAAGAVRMTGDDFRASGVLAPTEVFGTERAKEELLRLGVTFDVYAPIEEGV